jgi:hypothetical protein
MYLLSKEDNISKKLFKESFMLASLLGLILIGETIINLVKEVLATLAAN